MNDIQDKQNSAEALGYLCAMRRSYSDSKVLRTIELGGIVAVALAGAVASAVYRGATLWVALAAFVDVALNLLVLRPMIESRRKTGAAAQELFDQTVLDLPGQHPDVDRELLHELRARHEERPEVVEDLRDWYPGREVGELPMARARLVCQRANLAWDHALRDGVWRVYAVLAAVLAAIFCVVAYISAAPIDSLLKDGVFPSVPLFVYLLEQAIRQRDASRAAEHAKLQIERWWSHVVAGECTDVELLHLALSIQADLAARRREMPPVPDFVQAMRRRQLAKRMSGAATSMVLQLSRHAPLPPRDSESAGETELRQTAATRLQ